MMQAVLSLGVLMCLLLCTQQGDGAPCTPFPVAPKNGLISTTDNQEGAYVQYACSQGYALIRSGVEYVVVGLTCTSLGWDGSVPTCDARAVGSKCSLDVDCSTVTGSAFCDGPRGCACSAGYTENNGGCISPDDGASSSTAGLSRGAIAVIVVGSICGAVIIGLVIGILAYKLLC